jgi:hypothetical protein
MDGRLLKDKQLTRLAEDPTRFEGACHNVRETAQSATAGRVAAELTALAAVW